MDFYIIISMSATLANVTQNNYRLLAICNLCANTKEINLQHLVDRHGRDYPVPMIKRRLRCSRCDGESCAVQVALKD